MANGKRRQAIHFSVPFIFLPDASLFRFISDQTSHGVGIG
jgi:hypothetical protein